MRDTVITVLIAVLLCVAVNGFTQANPESAPRMELEEFKSLYAEGSVVVIDVRTEAEYEDGHIPEAIFIPVYDVRSRLAELIDVTDPIVTYCS